MEFTLKRITDITRRDIFDMLIDRYHDELENVYQQNSYWRTVEEEKMFRFYGRIDVIEFLNRIYDLEKLPSYNQKNNAKEDIIQHFVRNNDYSEYWLFDDERFELKKGNDEKFLSFLCEMFHPYVRNEKSAWNIVLNDINSLLLHDGYEIYEKGQISGRSVYGWKDILTKNIVIERQAENLAEKFNSEYIINQIKSMNGMIEISPYDAIGKAKELFESCCKTILKENNLPIENDWDIIRLTKEVCKILKLTPDDIDNAVKASDTIKKLLGNLSAISQSMAELRNSYGSGHGKDAKFKGLSSRHARLAVGSAVTAVHFLWETFEEQRKRGQL